MNADQIYNIVKNECEGLNSVYEDYIISLVGLYGLLILKAHRLIETCGAVNGRQLYVLCDKK